MKDVPVFPESEWTRSLVEAALAEDIGTGDASSVVSVPAGSRTGGMIVARQDGVVAGLPLLASVYGALGGEVSCRILQPDGTKVRPGDQVAELEGPAATLLSGERTALNFLQNLSGIASLTARYVDEVAGTHCWILDTRKTLPGYRALAKYAVRAGGGHNHRLGLYDRIMLKDNHWIAAGGSIAEAVARARRQYAGLAVEIEVDTLEQLAQVLPLDVEWVLLDNFDTDAVREAVRMRDEAHLADSCKLEASGNVNLETVRAYALAGVDAVSIGRLTHSAPALDIGLDFDTERVK